MKQNHTLLIQLPIPQLNFGRQTGNIPLGAACLKMAADTVGAWPVEILPERISSYLGDAALLEFILTQKPDIIGFTCYAWNIDRTLFLASQLRYRYRPHIVIGGPEITPDNLRSRSASVDTYVYGEGEAQFASLMKNHFLRPSNDFPIDADSFFHKGINPYDEKLLEPEIEKMVLVETQRGCPHRCGYCYYGKSRKGISTLSPVRVVDSIRWAIEHSIPEVYLLDPCLNARKDLHGLLLEIASANVGHTIQLISEIRAEKVTESMADQFSKAGFSWFEVGLQSTNPKALAIMNRHTDLDAFLRGTQNLKNRGIQVGIDVIVGLPGDSPKGFSRTIDFVVDHGLTEDVQVFPLSVLPGTPFRKQFDNLGLVFDPEPPYTIIETPTFSGPEISESLDEAQDRFDMSLYPFPDLDLSGCDSHFLHNKGYLFHHVDLSGISVITKAMINQSAEPDGVERWACRLAHPYQLFFGPKAKDTGMICQIIRNLTAKNPFTPLEIVFIDPLYRPDTAHFLSVSQLSRPHYLDKDLTYLYPYPGNRAMIFTLVSKTENLFFQEEMQRQVFRWTADSLPSRSDVEGIEAFDGILIPEHFGSERVFSWQKEMAPHHHTLPAITFADFLQQKQWIEKTQEEDYWLDLL